MTQNPYASPDFSGAPPATPPHLALRIPTISILVVTSLWTLYLGGISILVAVFETSRLFAPDRRLGAEEWQEILGTIVLPTCWLIFEGLIIYGAINMLRLRSYKAARLSAILSSLPLCSAAFVLGIPFGIWALIVLNRPEVKAAFERSSNATPKPPASRQ